MKNKLFILIPLLGLILAGCNEEYTPKEPINIDSSGIVDDGGGNTPGPIYIKDELTTPIALGETLPIGNKVVDGPSNLTVPDKINNEKTYSLYDSLPDNYTFIMGNNKVNSNNATFYEAGGLKLRNLYYGFQSSAFYGYKYVNIGFKISGVNDNNDKAKNDSIFHIYGYDKNSNCILKKDIEQGSITVQSVGSYINVEIHNENMMYFELRLNAFPCKGSQSYNVGISEVKIKGNN